jgi:intracellular septation protein
MPSFTRWLKPATDFGPLAVFLAAYYLWGLLPATAALMATTVAALGLSWAFERRLPLMPVVTAAIVLVFGGLTVWLNDDTFIKLKPTIVYALFAVVLGGGLALDRPVLQKALGAAVDIDDAGWRKLTLRFALFFAALALGNELVRRAVTTDLWVLWKVPGCLGLTIAFMLAQGPLIVRHQRPEAG